jgi:hypothetical protein
LEIKKSGLVHNNYDGEREAAYPVQQTVAPLLVPSKGTEPNSFLSRSSKNKTVLVQLIGTA